MQMAGKYAPTIRKPRRKSPRNSLIFLTTSTLNRSKNSILSFFRKIGFPQQKLPISKERPSVAKRYGVVLITVGSMTIIRLLMQINFGEGSGTMLIYILAVLVSAWYGGLGPGLAATALSGIIGVFFLTQPVLSLTVFSANERIRISLFLIEGILISILNEFLQQLNRRMADTLESITDAFISFDSELRYTFVNTRAEQLLRKKQDQLIGKKYIDIFGKQRSPLFEKRAKKALRTQKPSQFELYSHMMNMWLELHIYPSPDGLSIYFRDITKRRTIERQNAYLASLVTNVSDAIISTDKDYRIQSWNKAAEALYGWKANEVLGKNAMEFTSGTFSGGDPEKMQNRFRNSLLRKGAWRGEMLQKRKDGREIYVLASVSAVKDSRGKLIGFVTINRDITEHKEIERRRDEFVSIASHELKTPVTTIKAFSQIISKRLQQIGDEKNRYFVENINKQTDKLTVLINDLLDVSKIQAGKLIFEKKEFAIDEVIQKVIVDFQYTTETHQIINEGLTRKKAVGDPDRISQVLINLLSNAIKYSPKSDKVVVRSNVSEGMAQIAIQDFGMGIPKEKQARIFDRFYRVSESGNGRAGFGLGLYISAEIIRRHNGRIWVESPPAGGDEKGSTFYFTIPVKS